jgi:glycosyltransferase involved in cell wall biosynthesis
MASAAAIRSEIGGNSTLKVLACPQGIFSLLTLRHLQRAEKLEYVTWLMDDHLVRYRGGEWCYPSDVWGLMEEHLLGARQVFVISPALGEFYRQLFGISYKVLFGPADPVEQPVWDAPSSPRVKLGYFGSVTAWQLDPLQRLAELLQSVNATLDVFGGMSDLPSSLRLPNVKFRGRINNDAVMWEMRNYDAVVLPISFSDSMRHLTEFNIATKMSECLASGTATLVIGPRNAAMVRFLEPHRAAWIVSELTPKEVAVNILSLMTAESRKDRLANARKLVLGELSTATMRKRWLNVFAENEVH